MKKLSKLQAGTYVISNITCTLITKHTVASLNTHYKSEV